MSHSFFKSSLILLSLLLASCAGEHYNTDGGDGGNRAGGVQMEFHISAPMPTASTRVGDPGNPTGETVDWDRLTIIIAYTSKTRSDDSFDAEEGKMVYWDTFTREEFESLSEITHSGSTLVPVLDADGSDSGVRIFTMPLPLGTARVYGITYSSPSEAANESVKSNLIDFEARLKAFDKQGKSHNDEILAWEIPNTYASTNGTTSTVDVAKFLSVATGYGVNTKPGVASPYDLSIAKANDIEMKQYWKMTCRRLAAKLDVQWDAQQAYDNTKGSYVDVAINAFSYCGGASVEGEGNGRLFPFSELHGSAYTFSPVGGTSTFFNTTPISRRNGRVYHYFFPDGSKEPRVDFSISTQTEGSAVWQPYTYHFDFSQVAPLRPATWYKLNIRVKGNSGENTNIVVDNFQTGN